MQGITDYNTDYAHISIETYDKLKLFQENTLSGKVCTVIYGAHYNDTLYYTENEVIEDLTVQLNEAKEIISNSEHKLKEEIQDLKEANEQLTDEFNIKIKDIEGRCNSRILIDQNYALKLRTEHSETLNTIKQMNIFKFLLWKRKK